MKLKAWRTEKKNTLRETADLFGIGGGANPSRRMQRIETGEAPVDAVLADTIVRITEGVVSLQDLNDTRRDWLSGTRSEPEVAS